MLGAMTRLFALLDPFSWATFPGCQMGMSWGRRWENACEFPMFWFYMLALALVVVVALIFMIARCSSNSGRPPEESPLDILKRRYAKGEITREQFETFKRDMDL